MAGDDSDAIKALEKFYQEQARELAMLRAEQADPKANLPAVQQEQPQDDGISLGEYACWLTPQEAREALTNIWDLRTTRQELFSRLQNALIRTAAKIAIVRKYGREQARHEYKVIPETFWTSRQSPPDSHFWDTGSIQIHQREYQAEIDVSFFEVRFDPDQIAEIVRAQRGDKSQHEGADSESDPAAVSAKPRLDPDEVKRFCLLYLGIYNSNPKEIPAWNACKATFPENKVPRDYFLGIFRELRGPGNVGNPQLAKKP